MENWKQELLFLTVIYRILECNERIPLLLDGTDFVFLDKTLNDMNAKGFIEPHKGSEHWHVTDKGRDLRKQMLAIYDHALHFEIFGTVHLALTPPSDIADEAGNVMDHCFDPRFDAEIQGDELGTEDLRIAMMTFLVEEMQNDPKWSGKADLSPHRIVFIQMLADGKLRDGNIWFDLALGKFYDEVSQIVDSQYKWTDTAGSREESIQAMQAIYTAGMLEQRKRDGSVCSSCQIPLAVFELDAQRHGHALSRCPNPDCNADFNPPVVQSQYTCPACERNIHSGQRKCQCGAIIDFSLAPGTIETTETVEETMIWNGGNQGYVSYGYYDPWDPFYDMVAFSTVCMILIN